MTWPFLALLFVIYTAAVVWMNRRQMHLALYVFGAFGLAFLIVQFSVLQNWHIDLQVVEAYNVRTIMSVVNVDVQVVNGQTLLVPDSTGWSGLNIGPECSSLLELAVFIGLIMYYPQLPLKRRWLSLLIGGLGIYVLNLGRILIVVLMVFVWGKPIVPFAHVFVARIFYFAGIIVLYWFFLTQPMLTLIRQAINRREAPSTEQDPVYVR